MKISKLFHWLYAILMLLPVFFIAGRCLYTIFNKNAKDSYYGETINEELEVRVLYSSMIPSNDYIFNNGTGFTEYQTYNRTRLQISNLILNGVAQSDINYLNFGFNSGQTINRIEWSRDGSDFAFFTNLNEHVYFTFTFLSGPQTIPSVLQDFYQIEYNKYSYLDNAFIYSVNQLNEVPLFSWAKDSFLVTPFTFITGLFGVPNDSPINTMLSYWLDISIIWLVFDLVMYVPLLVHRWLDKGVLE